jgi:pimeloyl-ACP methyl ester carboxylesterase
LRRESVTRGVASNPWVRVEKPVDYLCTGRVGIAETNRQRVRILAVGVRDGRLRVKETDLKLGDGRTLHAYDTAVDEADGRLAVFWHHGSPNIGAPPEPLFPAAEELGVRWASYDRPGYGGSTPSPDRDVGAAVADALDLDRFAVMGHSGGGSHALACAALLPERVPGAVVVAGMAPFGAEGLDWFEGFGPGGEAQLRAAAAGRAALEKHLAESDDEPGFTPEDEAALAGEWSWFIDVVRPALAGGMEGFIDDDLAGVGEWGFDPAVIVAPTLFVHGDRDRIVPSSHSEWLARRCPSAELRLYPDDGHITVLNHGAEALGWLREHAHRD